MATVIRAAARFILRTGSAGSKGTRDFGEVWKMTSLSCFFRSGQV